MAVTHLICHANKYPLRLLEKGLTNDPFRETIKSGGFGGETPLSETIFGFIFTTAIVVFIAAMITYIFNFWDLWLPPFYARSIGVKGNLITDK